MPKETSIKPKLIIKSKTAPKFVVFKNEDKDYNNKNIIKKDLDNYVFGNEKPFRLLIIAPPNSGKTTIIKNLLLHNMFDKIYIVHFLAEMGTHEYDKIDNIMFDELPDYNEIINDNENEEEEDKPRKLLIIEDFDFKHSKKEQKERMSRYLGAVSTHNNLSIIVTCQKVTMLEAAHRTLFNYVIIFKNEAYDNEFLCRSLSIPRPILNSIFEYCVIEPNDFLLIDRNFKKKNGEVKYRLNFVNKIIF